FHQAAVGARMIHAGARMNREAPDMRLIDDGLRPGVPEWLISLPIEGLVDQHAFRHRCGIVPGRARKVFPGSGRIIASRGCEVPRRPPRYRCRERVEEKPVEIETMAFDGLVGTV